MMYENKKVTFHFVTIEVQNFFSNSDYDFFFMIFDITESDSSVIIENSSSATTVTTFIQSISVKFTLINSTFNVANSFLKEKNDSNKKIHVKKSFFSQSTDSDFKYLFNQSVQFQISFIQNSTYLFQFSILSQNSILSSSSILFQNSTLSQISVFNQQFIMFFIQTTSFVILFSINQLFNSKFIFQQSKSESVFFSVIEIRTKKKFSKKFKKKLKFSSL